MRAMGVIVTSFFLSLLLFGQARSDIAVVTGNCVIINQSIELQENSALNQEVNCETPNPDDAFRVRYIWLDANSTSFLLANVLPNDLKKMLGDDPIIAQNAVYQDIKDIWRNHSTKVTINNGYVFSKPGVHFSQVVANKKGLTDGQFFQLKDFPKNELNKIMFYDASDEVVWPYVSQLKKTYESSSLTPDMNITYGYGNDAEFNRNRLNEMRSSINDYVQFSNQVYSCTLSYDFVSKSDYQNYWNDTDLLKRQLEQSSEFKEYVSFIEPSLDFTSKTLASNASLDSFEYFTQKNWPSDFLVRYYQHTFEGCDREPSLRVIPRQLFFKIAVVQSKTGKFDLKGYSFKESTFAGLRKLDDKNYSDTKFFGTGETGREKGQSLVIPMAIELRYPTDEFPFSAILRNQNSKKYHDQIKKSSFPNFGYFQYSAGYGDQPKAVITKNKSEFSEPVHSTITRTYVFGSEIEIDSIQVGDTNIQVRSAPAIASLLNGGFEEGSCPFLYFELANGEVVKHGRILIGAHGAENEFLERIQIPENAVNVMIREEEPEVAFLKSISLANETNSNEIILAEMVRLNPQGEMILPLPIAKEISERPENSIRYLNVTGFYRQLK